MLVVDMSHSGAWEAYQGLEWGDKQRWGVFVKRTE